MTTEQLEYAQLRRDQNEREARDAASDIVVEFEPGGRNGVCVCCGNRRYIPPMTHVCVNCANCDEAANE